MGIRPYPNSQAIQEACSWCGKANWFPPSSLDQIVVCEECGREFLLCYEPRDSVPRRIGTSLATLLTPIRVVSDLIVVGSLIIVALILVILWLLFRILR